MIFDCESRFRRSNRFVISGFDIDVVGDGLLEDRDMSWLALAGGQRGRLDM